MLARHMSASERSGGNSLAEKIALVKIHAMLKAKIFHRKKILSFLDLVISSTTSNNARTKAKNSLHS